jgi:hypothetical protein
MIGYKFKNKNLLLQSVVHKSMSEKLCNQFPTFFEASKGILDQHKDREIIMSFNHQILEYLGDSLMNFTVSKAFYCETVECYDSWHGDYFPPTKLHEIKTWFTSNMWISFALYDNFFNLLRDTEVSSSAVESPLYKSLLSFRSLDQ